MSRKVKEQAVQAPTKEESFKIRIAERMAERLRNSNQLADDFQATLDPRQFQTKEHEDGRS